MINDYDKFAAERQKEIQGGKKSAHRFIEKPAMKALLPDLSNRRVLMLGCGTGDESLILEAYGAQNIEGIDSSAESIKLAQKTYPKHHFTIADMHKVEFADSSFDFIYSSLTLHYSSHPLDAYKEAFRLLKPGGAFQFSIGHPMRWAAQLVEVNDIPTKILGFTEGDTPVRTYGNYSDFRQYSDTYPNGEILEYWIGPPSLHFTLLREAGFDITEFTETRATEECKELNPSYYKRFNTFPAFAIFVAQKPSA